MPCTRDSKLGRDFSLPTSLPIRCIWALWRAFALTNLCKVVASWWPSAYLSCENLSCMHVKEKKSAADASLLQVNVQQVWMSLSSGVLAFVFIFGNNIRNIYESCLLLFVVHPFDVGDVLFLDKDQWCQVLLQESSEEATFHACTNLLRPSSYFSKKPFLADCGCL